MYGFLKNGLITLSYCDLHISEIPGCVRVSIFAQWHLWAHCCLILMWVAVAHLSAPLKSNWLLIQSTFERHSLDSILMAIRKTTTKSTLIHIPGYRPKSSVLLSCQAYTQLTRSWQILSLRGCTNLRLFFFFFNCHRACAPARKRMKEREKMRKHVPNGVWSHSNPFSPFLQPARIWAHSHTWLAGCSLCWDQESNSG